MLISNRLYRQHHGFKIADLAYMWIQNARYNLYRFKIRLLN